MDATIDFDKFVEAIQELELEESESHAMYHPSRVNNKDWEQMERELRASETPTTTDR